MSTVSENLSLGNPKVEVKNEKEKKENAELKKFLENLSAKCEINMENSKDFISNPFLYLLKKENKEFYILGTNHALSYKSFPESLKKIIRTIKTLVLEHVEEECDDRGIPVSLSQFRRPHKPKKMLAQFNKLDKEVQKKFLDKFGDMAYEFEPWLLCHIFLLDSSFDQVVEDIHATGEEQTLQLDSVIEHEVMEGNHGKRFGLETHADRALALGMQSLTLENISSGIKGLAPDELDIESDKFLDNAYVSGDKNGMLTILEEAETIQKEDPNNWIFLSSKSTIVRNKNWVLKIEHYLSDPENESPMLVCVGCSHLFGEEGLLDLLTKKGFSVTRVLDFSFFKKNAFLVAYALLQFARLDFRSANIVIDYLFNASESDKQAEWGRSVNQPAMLWAYNVRNRLHHRTDHNKLNEFDSESQDLLWKLGT